MEESTESESKYDDSLETKDSSDSESEEVSGGTLHIDLNMFIRRRPRCPSVCSSSSSNTTIHWLSLKVNSMPSPESQFNVPSLTDNPNGVELPTTMETTPCSDENELIRKGPLAPEEDQRLIDYIQIHGHGNWSTLPMNAALGGHRASHKKQRLMGEDSLVKVPNSSSKPKIHECSICGLEFAIGQALGGHMRRHRTAIMGEDSLVKVPISSPKRKIHECCICGLEFAIGQALGGHMRRHRNIQFTLKSD